MRAITFLSDYGLADPFVGVCHAVIERIAPGARVIDLTHEVARQDVRHGALVLADCIPWLPSGVHLAVVDPGVGTARRALIIAAGGHFLVGPDNGLLWPAAHALGGMSQVWQIHADPAASATFHGRDVFAPAAARLASGADPGRLGAPVDPAGVQRLDFPAPTVAPKRIEAEVLAVDRFGNAQLNVGAAELTAAGLVQGRRAVVAVGSAEHQARVCTTFADVAPGELAVLEDSFRRIALAVNQGSAAERLDARPGARVRLEGLDLSAP